MALPKFLTKLAGRSAQAVAIPPAIAISMAAQNIVAPLLQSEANWANRTAKDSPLSPAEAAAAVARRLMSLQEGAAEAANSGLDGDRFATLRALQRALPATGELLTLVRRGKLGADAARSFLRVAGYDDADAAMLVDLAEELPDAGTLRAAVNRGAMPEGEAVGVLRRQGLSQAHAEAAIGARQAFPDSGTVQEAVNRGEMSEAQALAALRGHGLSDADARAILALRLAVPGPADVVRFAVREAFDPGKVAAYGMDEALPPEAVEMAQRAGLSEEFFRLYWRAHWELPSVTQAFEMYQRNVISEAELDDLLQAQDVMPVWRGRLKAIAYAPITRVDLRRLFKAGVIDMERLVRGYMDLGYARDNAEALAKWTALDQGDEERALTKTEILDLYEAGSIPRTQAVDLVRGLGYTAEATALVLALADHRIEYRRRNRQVNVVRSRYVGRKLDQGEASAALDAIGVPPSERDDLLADWDAERQATTPEMTVTQLATLWNGGVISQDRFVAELQDRGYSEEERQWWLYLATPKSQRPTNPAA